MKRKSVLEEVREGSKRNILSPYTPGSPTKAGRKPGRKEKEARKRKGGVCVRDSRHLT